MKVQKFSLSIEEFLDFQPFDTQPLTDGPIFLVDTATCAMRISWMEVAGSRNESVPADPDMIDLAIWPSRTSEQ